MAGAALVDHHSDESRHFGTRAVTSADLFLPVAGAERATAYRAFFVSR
jgi:hypothetical protein